MLDLNALAEGHPFLALGASAVSDDGRLLAYSTDVTGFREYTLHVKDLRDGRAAARPRREGRARWPGPPTARRSSTSPRTRPSARTGCTATGSAPRGTTCCYEETDVLFRLGVGRSRSRAYLFLISGSFTTTEVRYLLRGDPAGAWRMIAAARAGPRVRRRSRPGPTATSSTSAPTAAAANFRLVTAPVDDPRPGALERGDRRIATDVMLEDVDVFARHYVVHEREDGLIRLRVTDAAHRRVPSRASSRSRPTTLSADANAEFDTDVYRLPLPVADHARLGVRLRHRGARACAPAQAAEVLGGYDPARYRSERIHATAADGTRVPISLVRRADAPRRLEPDAARRLRRLRLSLPGRVLVEPAEPARSRGDRGHRPHPRRRRAGQALARRGPHAGTSATPSPTSSRRPSTWSRSGYTAPDRLVIEGGSAGGLLMGAVLNLRPELLRGRGAAGAVRRRDQHHARRVAAAHGGRVRGVGQSRRSASSTST